MVCLALTACATGPVGDEEEGALGAGTAASTCTPQAGADTYGMQDFPCTSATVEGWVTGREGTRTRTHAWYLLAGLTKLQPSGDPLWMSWPTTTQIFPDQFAEGSHVVGARAARKARLEHPAPGTPRHVGEAAGGENPTNLSLPGSPAYQLPSAVATNPAYAACVRDHADGPQLIDGPTFQNNGDAMLARVVFSPDAAEWIVGTGMNQAGYLNSLLPAPTAPAVQLEMNPNAVVLKAMMWSVPYDQYTALPLWSDPSPDADKPTPTATCEVYAGFESPDASRGLWGEAVALTAGTPTGRAADATYLQGGHVQRYTTFSETCVPGPGTTAPITYPAAQVVSLDRFYQVRFSDAELQALDACDRALLDQTAYWSYDRAFDARDVLVLMAMHIMTRESPDWTFQSAWWHVDAQSDQCPSGPCRYGKSRPSISNVDGPDTWTNYLMTTTYGIEQQPGNSNYYAPPGTGAASWPVAYNPYIELAATHPIDTNCKNCHLRAAWPSRSDAGAPRHGAYLVDAPGAPNVVDVFDMSNPIYEGLVTVDNMWTISDRASGN